MTPPNILLITTHDINPHLGTYAGIWPGAEEAITPNLDRLADEGVRYNNAFATAPVCAPSRSSMMTGCYPSSIGTMHMRTKAVVPAEVRLLPQILREAGYYTLNNFFTDYQMDVPPTTFDDISPTAHWRNRPTGAPFFAQFHGMITHESQIYLDDDAFAAATSHVSEADRHDADMVTIPPYYPDTPVFRASWARYLDLITEMDHWVGELLGQLDEDGLTDSTVVVFVSDHGLGMPRAKRWANESGLREPFIVRWPGAVSPGTVVDNVVSLVDLAPTLLAVAGQPIPEFMQGVPLLTAPAAAPAKVRPYVYGGRDRMDEQEDTSRTVRDDRFRFTRNYHPDRSPMQHHEYADKMATWSEFRRLSFEEAGQLAVGEQRDRLTELQRSVVAPSKPEHELYDISVDPHEQHNLAQRPEFEDDVRRMSQALSEWQTEVGDLGLLPEDALIESWRPGGQKQCTADLETTVEDGRLLLSCATPGALIGWQQDTDDTSALPEVPAAHAGWMATLGLETDRRSWLPYTGPLAVSGTVRAKAWRIGFSPSNEVVVEV
jgi:N-sulfoglucosamine sulfohydrolase